MACLFFDYRYIWNLQRLEIFMLHCLPDAEIERLIEEHVPYGDLTTSLLGIGDKSRGATLLKLLDMLLPLLSSPLYFR